MEGHKSLTCSIYPFIISPISVNGYSCVIYSYLEMYCQIMLNNFNLCCQIAWQFHSGLFSGSVFLSCFSLLKGVFIYMMDNGAILNILSHKYSSSLFGPLPAYSTQRHITKLGFLKNIIERVVCQWHVTLSQIPDGITEVSLSLNLSHHSNPEFLPGLLSGKQILEIHFSLATSPSISPSLR